MSNVVKLERKPTGVERMAEIWQEQEEIRQAETYLCKRKAVLQDELTELFGY